MRITSGALALSAIGLLGCLVAETAAAQDTEIAVGDYATSVETVTLQAGEAFAFDDATLSDGGKVKLDSVLGFLDSEYVYRVDVTGYTDRIGDEAHNVALSERRAQSVADYLAEAGIAAERINVEGMGSVGPIVFCENLRGDELVACLAPNRRTEVRFFYPQAQTTATAAVRQQLSTAAGEYVSIYNVPVGTSDFAAKAIEVFMEGCSADLDTYCAQVTPGEQRLLACVYAHEDKISQGCKASLGDALLLVRTDIAEANFIGKLCGNDIMAHCGDVVPGDGRIEACLVDSADLSETCSRALLALPRQ